MATIMYCIVFQCLVFISAQSPCVGNGQEGKQTVNTNREQAQRQAAVETSNTVDIFNDSTIQIEFNYNSENKAQCVHHLTHVSTQS